MAFDAATLALVEDALSECFKYHSSLDTFLLRSGVGANLLSSARERAEERNSGRYSKAPKRLVVQEVLAAVPSAGAAADTVVAALITGLTRSTFRDATPEGIAALNSLKAKVASDADEQTRIRKEERERRAQSQRAKEQVLEGQRAAKQAERDALRDRFMALMAEGNAQTRGYLLEVFLNDLFEFEGLDPRGSFRLVGEQIDGAFAWRGRTCLVEAKWVKGHVAGKEFGAFNYKIEGKTLDTRGLYVSINGYSAEAITGMNSKGALRFVCIDGAHIVRALVSSEGLVPILERVWRYADETGDSYLPVSKL